MCQNRLFFIALFPCLSEAACGQRAMIWALRDYDNTNKKNLLKCWENFRYYYKPTTHMKRLRFCAMFLTSYSCPKNSSNRMSCAKCDHLISLEAAKKLITDFFPFYLFLKCVCSFYNGCRCDLDRVGTSLIKWPVKLDHVPWVLKPQPQWHYWCSTEKTHTFLAYIDIVLSI